MLPIEIAGVAAGQESHESGKRFCTDLEGHVNVIGHPAIGMQAVPVADQAILQKALPLVPIITVQKYWLTRIAPQNRVIKAAGNVESWFSRNLPFFR
jgi:hypothetical protein